MLATTLIAFGIFTATGAQTQVDACPAGVSNPIACVSVEDAATSEESRYALTQVEQRPSAPTLYHYKFVSPAFGSGNVGDIALTAGPTASSIFQNEGGDQFLLVDPQSGDVTRVTFVDEVGGWSYEARDVETDVVLYSGEASGAWDLDTSGGDSLPVFLWLIMHQGTSCSPTFKECNDTAKTACQSSGGIKTFNYKCDNGAVQCQYECHEPSGD